MNEQQIEWVVAMHHEHRHAVSKWTRKYVHFACGEKTDQPVWGILFPFPSRCPGCKEAHR